MSIVGAYPILLAALWPTFGLADQFDSGVAIGSVSGIDTVLWRESVVFMGVIGALFSTVARGAHRSPFAFTVPSLRSRVLRGKLTIGAAVALLISIALAFAGDPSDAAGIFSCGLLCFAIGSALVDPPVPRYAALGGGILFIGAAVQPQRVISVFEFAPFPATILSLIAAAALVRREWSPEMARRRAVLQAVPSGYPLGARFKRAYSENEDIESTPWLGSPFTGRIRDWFSAADYEIFGSRRRGWLRSVTWFVMFASVIAYGLLGDPGFAAAMGTMQLSTFGHRLLGKWAYPIGRSRRADLHFFYSLFDSATYYLFALIVIWMLESSGVPRFPMFGDTGARTHTIAIVPITFIWVPIAQWVRVTSSGPVREIVKSWRWGLRFLVHVLVTMQLAYMTYNRLTELARMYSLTLAISVALGLTVVVQISYWLALRWHFGRSNLV